jgi:hypothetical protein
MKALPPRTSLTGPSPMADAVADALSFRGISDDVRAERILTEWGDLVGPKMAQRTRPYGIVDRTLRIEVSTSAWLHELNLLRPQLFKTLTAALSVVPGDPPLFDVLKFHLAGSYRRRPVSLRPPSNPTEPRRVVVSPAVGADRDRIVREAGAVDDIELRELIERVRIAHDR